MNRISAYRAAGLLLTVCVPCLAFGQGFGGAGGFGSGSGELETAANWAANLDALPMTPEAIQSVIVVSGTAEIRVVPEQIRVVMAVTSEGGTAEECQQKDTDRIRSVREAWQALRIPEDQIVEDFISVLPRYEWNVESRDGTRFEVQKLAGYRMQSNLHVSVPDEAAAMSAIRQAFQQGVTDIVTFDYWSSQLDERQDAARQQALEAAKKKAELLLAVFDPRPPVINVQEQTAVFFPRSLYTTYENVLEEEQSWSSDRDRRAIQAYRPKLSFFDGLQSQSDVRPKQAAMRPEIAVVSTVKLYYRSPAAKNVNEDD